MIFVTAFDIMMLSLKFLIIIAYLILYTTAITPNPCLLRSFGYKGFTARYYEYSTEYSAIYTNSTNCSFLVKDNVYLGARNNITKLQNYIPANAYTGENEIFGFPIIGSQFIVQLQGYYIPPKTGHYNFILQLDNLAFIKLGASQALENCKRDLWGQSVEHSLNTTCDYDNHTITNIESKYHLLAGLVYPLKIIWVNRKDLCFFNFTIVDSTGEMVDTFENIMSYEESDDIKAIFNTKNTVKQIHNDDQLTMTIKDRDFISTSIYGENIVNSKESFRNSNHTKNNNGTHEVEYTKAHASIVENSVHDTKVIDRPIPLLMLTQFV